jgi:hypothetical protein
MITELVLCYQRIDVPEVFVPEITKCFLQGFIKPRGVVKTVTFSPKQRAGAEG